MKNLFLFIFISISTLSSCVKDNDLPLGETNASTTNIRTACSCESFAYTTSSQSINDGCCISWFDGNITGSDECLSKFKFYINGGYWFTPNQSNFSNGVKQLCAGQNVTVTVTFDDKECKKFLLTCN